MSNNAFSFSMTQFVGAKLAAPHTCLPLSSTLFTEVVRTVSQSSKRVLAIHTGTTPFCGALGKMFGINACCSPEYVNPLFLNNTVSTYANTSFVLLHSGFDFLPPDDENYYNGSLVDASIELALLHENVYLEISALHAQTSNGTDKYPGADEALIKISNAGLSHRVIWASDGNHNEGSVLLNLQRGIESMIQANFTDEERCLALTENPMNVFNLELPTEGNVADPSMDDIVTDTSAAYFHYPLLLVMSYVFFVIFI